MALALGLVLAAALMILLVSRVSPHQQQRRQSRSEECDSTANGGWNPAYVSGDNGVDCSAGDAGSDCDGGGDGGGGGD